MSTISPVVTEGTPLPPVPPIAVVLKESELPEVPAYLANKNISYQDVRIYDTYVEMTLPDGRTKVVTVSAFKEIFERSIKNRTSIMLDDYILPSGCYLFSVGNTEMRISCYYPEKIRTVEFHGESKKYEIPFPNVVINHTLVKETEDKWRIKNSLYYCTAKNIGALPLKEIQGVNPKEKIWGLALPNMHSDCRLCYGRNTMPMNYTKNLRGLDWFYAVLYNSPFNNDLSNPWIRSGERGNKWLETLSNHKTFPYDLLT